ncbi:MAG: N-acetylmuramoyl-L-alanine amidase [Pseudomonadota bacterium]
MDRAELGASLNLRTELIPESNGNRSGRPIAPKFITIHNTANTSKGADADAHSRFVRNKGFYILKSGKKNHVSWHFTVDDGCVIKHLPVNERAIHAGKANGVSVAIEICMNKGIDQTEANWRAARLVAVLMHDLKIPLSNIKPHKHWTGKHCPSLLVGDFENFCNMCDAVFAAMPTSPAEAVPPNFEDVLLTEEIEAVSLNRDMAEQGMLVEDAIEDDPAEEHGAIAVEVEAFIEGEKQ